MVSERAKDLVQNNEKVCQYGDTQGKCEQYPFSFNERPDGYIDLSVAENNIMWDFIHQKLQMLKIEENDVHYSSHWHGHIRQNVSQFLNKYLKYNSTSESIVIGSGGGPLLEQLLFTLGDEGDHVIVLAPMYANFEKIITYRNHLKLVALNLTDIFGSSGLDDLESLIVDLKPKVLLLANPNNPTGQVATEKQLEALIDMCCNKHGIHMIVDEVYALSVFASQKQFFTASTIAERLGAEKLVHCLYSFSKDFAISGLRAGIIHSLNSEVIDAMKKLARFVSSSTLTQKCLLSLIIDESFLSSYIQTLKQRLEKRVAQVTQGLDKLNIEYIMPEGGLFIFINFRPLLKMAFQHVNLVSKNDDNKSDVDYDSMEGEFLNYLMKEIKCLIAPGTPAKAKEAGWFRICSAQQEDVLLEFMKRLEFLVQKIQQNPISEVDDS